MTRFKVLTVIVALGAVLGGSIIIRAWEAVWLCSAMLAVILARPLRLPRLIVGWGMKRRIALELVYVSIVAAGVIVLSPEFSPLLIAVCCGAAVWYVWSRWHDLAREDE